MADPVRDRREWSGPDHAWLIRLPDLELEGDKVPVVDSEFADVSVEVDTAANGPRLRLEDRRTGRIRFLDALELETIVWLPDGHLTQLLDPSADRWRDA
jgi:hypothetical protein